MRKDLFLDFTDTIDLYEEQGNPEIRADTNRPAPCGYAKQGIFLYLIKQGYTDSEEFSVGCENF